MKILVYSDHKWIEDSFPFFIEQISRSKGVVVDSIDRVPTPKKVPPFQDIKGNGFIYPDWDWFYNTMTKPVEDEYGLVVWHDTRAQGREYQKGASRRFNGVYDNVKKDRTFNCVVFSDNKISDERTHKHQNRYPGITDFERVFLHEVSHGFSRYKGHDSTHFFDYILHNIPGAFLTYDLSGYETQNAIISTLQKTVELLKRLVGRETWHVPVPKVNISQQFGVLNPIYPQTGRHIGLDYAVPVGTQVFAPVDCEINKTGHSRILGNYCEIESTFRGEKVWARYMHLDFEPEKRAYKKGEVIGLSGNTGLSTGPHLHVDVRRDDVKKANEDNWNDIFLDPNQVFGHATI